MATYSENDWRNYSEDSLEHGWGTSPEQKKREREYNHEYWEAHKDEILARRKRSQNRYTDDAHKTSGQYDKLTSSLVRGYRRGGGKPTVEDGLEINRARNDVRSRGTEFRYGGYGDFKADNREARAERLEQLGNQREIRELRDANARRYAASQAVAKRGYQDSQAGASEGRYSDSGTGNARAGASSGRYAAASGTRSQVVKPGSASSGSSSDSGSGTRAVVAQAKKKVNQIAQRAVELGQKALDRVIKLQQNKR